LLIAVLQLQKQVAHGKKMTGGTGCLHAVLLDQFKLAQLDGV
jgi:hypothetical protein